MTPEWTNLLIPLMNDPVKSLYSPETHNEAVAILQANGVEGDLDEMVCCFCNGDSYAIYVMEKAKALRVLKWT